LAVESTDLVVRRRRLVRQSLVVVGTSTVSIAVLAWLAYSSGSGYENVLAAISAEAEMRSALDETLQLVVDAETGQRGYLISQNRAFLEPLAPGEHRVSDALGRVRRHLRSTGHEEDYRALEAAVIDRNSFTAHVVSIAHRDVEAARALVASGAGKRRTDRVRHLVAEIARSEEQRVRALRDRAGDERARFFLAFLAMLAATLTTGGYSIVLVRRELRSVEEAAQLLATSERNARQGERQFRLLAEGATDLVVLRDREGRVLYANPAVTSLLGYTPEEIVAIDPNELVPAGEREPLEAMIDAALASTDPVAPVVHRVTRKDGSVGWFATRVVVSRDEAGVVDRFHTASRDVTKVVEENERRAREVERLADLATRDELTGLYNRRGFLDAVEPLLEIARQGGTPALLVFCDVNGLKLINDELGHEAGDDVIRDAANLLRSSTRGSDVVARLGGDELVVFGLVRDEDAARTFETRLRDAIRTHNERGERAYRVSISIGTARWDPDDPKSIEALLKDADTAMYAQKRLLKRGATPSGHMIVPPRRKQQ
jgi:diguanylate cyclase (GGDEF)-like protein/PAS domain S-box-containing protein